MSTSHKALKLVQKTLPQLCLCKDMLVLPPTEHILRGFSFDSTPYKEKFYLWRVILPLYRYHSRKTLDYSKRIPRGARVGLSRERPEHSAAEIATIISEDIPNMEGIRMPCDFLAHIGWMIGNDSPPFLLDLAVTYFLVGRVDDAVASLRQLETSSRALIAYYAAASRPKRPIIERLTEIRRIAGNLAEQIADDPAAAAQTINEWERNNIAAFDLGRTVVDAARP
jgi:hypothetical protein